jgi:hypothetical protein
MGLFHIKYRAAAGRLLVIALTGYAILGLLWRSIEDYRNLPEKAPVTLHEERINLLKPLLPPFGAVGYVTSVENEKIFAYEKTFRNVEYVAQYVLTQYTLAPLIVRNSPAFPLVVGNFLDGPPPPGFIEKNGLVVLKDFGDGLILYGKETGR